MVGPQFFCLVLLVFFKYMIKIIFLFYWYDFGFSGMHIYGEHLYNCKTLVVISLKSSFLVMFYVMFFYSRHL